MMFRKINSDIRQAEEQCLSSGIGPARRNADLGVVYYHLRHAYDLDSTPVLLWTSGENAECLIYLNYAFILVRLCFDLRAKTITVIELSCP
jgi:hypothetical protein